MEARERTAPNGNGRGSDRLAAHAGESARQIVAQAREAVDDLKTAIDIDGHVDRHPYGTLAAALGIGYALGGGIFTPLTSRIVGLGLRIGIRLAVLPVLERELSTLVESLGEPTAARSGRSRRANEAKANEGGER